jgi:NADPH:quinone reductase-like Zn-dependent oxidoreductase
VQTDESRAFWIVAPGRGEIRAERLDAHAPGRVPGVAAAVDAVDVVVRALYSGISRGTEALVFNGLVPVSEYARMRAPFQAGEFPGPVKYGYASVGQVEQGPPELNGRHVFVLHPHQTRYIVPADAVHVLPEHVPPARAVLAANLETAINVIWDARPQVGDRVSVVGAGTVGCLVAWLAARIPGCQVELVDVNPHRAAVARALGANFAAPAAATAEADLVVHASGSPDGLARACALAAFEATIVEASWYGNRVVPLALGEAFHARRLTLKSSQVGAVAASQRARWDTRRRMRLALSLLVDPVLDVLITGESAFEDLPATMAALAASPGHTLCHRIKYV